MSGSYLIFDRNRVRRHRDRAAHTLRGCDFLLKECCLRLAERLQEINRMFPVLLDLGAHHGLLKEYLPASSGIELLIQGDLSPAMIAKATGVRVVADEEFLPFADASVDLVMSVFSMHWINDLPGALIQINRILKPGGLMLVMMPGGETLKELRQSFEQAELLITGGIGPHISPFIDARDGAGLLQRAGFDSPVADSETVNVYYENPMHLINDLRQSGEANTLIASAKNRLTRPVIYEAMEYYRRHFSAADGRVNATCEMVTLTGWKKDG